MDRRSIRRTVAWLVLGFLIGAGIGLFLGWVAWPLEFSETDPADMDERFQVDYTLMIAAAYSDDMDLSEAGSRLSRLAKDDAGRWVLGMAVDYILNGESEADILKLVILANDMGQYSPIMDPYLAQIESARPS